MKKSNALVRAVIVKMTKVNLKPGETLFVTFRSDDLDHTTLAAFRDQLRNGFPNNKVAVIGLGTKDDVKFTSVNPNKGVRS
jgi:hypothetical protein